jgi:site-specific DNA-adenine methylase
MTMLRAVRYPGGKFRCYQKLINLIPPHRVYIETHVGGGAVLRNKAPAELNIGVDSDVAVIRSLAKEFGSNYQFISGTAEKFLLGYQFAGDEFVYVDPPYWPGSKRSKRSRYRHNYTEEGHFNLLGILRKLPCKVMISGYANAAYNGELSAWRRYVFMGTSHTGQREETLWMNFEPFVLHDTRYLGSTFREREGIKRKRARWTAKFCREPLAVQQGLLLDLADAFFKQTNQRILQ